ncbi:MAG: nucleotidyltransferase family protein [Bacteroidetes bacterium]|nr:nucleotidyltransferase family protein [Bacteroidota bacterium]
MTKQEIFSIIINYLKQFPIEKIGVFGSFARNEHKANSDIDILVSYKETIDLFTLARMHRELEERLQRKVDIVNEKYLHPRMKSSIKSDLKIIASQ